jgi:excisionase family DNA binding protein
MNGYAAQVAMWLAHVQAELDRMPKDNVVDILAAAELERRYFTAEQAAEYLGGLNARTVSRWAREGYLPSIPLGEGKRRLWRFVQADLDEWMNSRRSEGEKAA